MTFATKRTLGLLGLAVLALTACAGTDTQRIERLFAMYPFHPVGVHAPPAPSVEQGQAEREAKEFIPAHPRAALAFVKQHLRDNPGSTAKGLDFLASYPSPVYEDFFLHYVDRRDVSEIESPAAIIGFFAAIRTRRAVPRLLQLGRHEELTRHVVEALRKIADPRATAFLLEAAHSNDYWTALAAMEALGDLHEARAVEPLCAMVRDESLAVARRARAARALSTIGDLRAVPTLREHALLRDNADYPVLWALLDLNPRNAVEHVKATGNTDLAKYLEPEDADPWLLEVANDPTGEQTGAATRMLAMMGDARVAPLLKEALLGLRPQPARPAELVSALQQLGDPEWQDVRAWGKEVCGTRVEPFGDPDEPANFLEWYAAQDPEREMALREYPARADLAADAALLVKYLQEHKLRDLPPEQQRAACRLLASQGVREAVGHVVKVLQGGSYEAREEAVRALGVLGGPPEAKLLLEELRRVGYELDLADAIYHIGDRSVIPALREMLDVGREWTVPAAYCLARFGDETGKQHLLDLIPTSRIPTDAETQRWLTPVDWLDPYLLEALRRLKSTKAVAPLRRVLQMWEPGDRTHAETASVLASLGDGAGFAACEAYLRSSTDEGNLEAALRGLIENGRTSRRLLRLLMKRAQSEDPRIRRQCLWALGELGTKRTLRALYLYPVGKRADVLDTLREAVRKLETRHPGAAKEPPWAGAPPEREFFHGPMEPTDQLVLRLIETCGRMNAWEKPWRSGMSQRCILQQLRKISDPRATSVLIDVIRLPARRVGEPEPEPPYFTFGDDEPPLAAIAAGALAGIGRPAMEPLLEAFQDGDANVRYWAVWALAHINAEPAHEAMRKALRDESGRVRSRAISEMEIVRNPVLLEEAEWLLRYEGDDWTASDTAGALGRIGTEEALNLLISAVAEEQSGQHGWAITALGETDNPRAIQHLIPCLEAEQEPVRFRAAMALGKLGCENATPLLIRYALEEGERWREAVDVLRKLDPGAARLVLHERVRGGPCLETEIRLLAEMGDKTIVPRLIEILKSQPRGSRFPLVRMLAVVAGVAPLAQVLVAERVERYSPGTYLEARDALRKLTGENLESYEEWRAWEEAHPVSPSQE